jgi:hypothetical protein
MTAVSRVVHLAGELAWFLVMVMAIPVCVLVIVLPLGFVAMLLMSIVGLH